MRNGANPIGELRKLARFAKPNCFLVYLELTQLCRPCLTTEEIQDAHSMFYITHSHETRLKSHLQTDAIYAMLKIFLLIHLRLMKYKYIFFVI